MSIRFAKWPLIALSLLAVAFLGWRLLGDSEERQADIQVTPIEPLDVTELEDADYGARFRAALELVGSEQESFDARLAAALRRMPTGSPLYVALDYVRWKRSGEPLPKAAVQPAIDKPNVVLVSIDTLRADHLGCYGYARNTSPHIDELASEGVLFENAFSTAPWTLPGHMSIFTALYPSFHKLESGRPGGALRLDPSEQTLAESLRDAGYRTAAFVTHPFLSARWGFDQGFDLYFRPPVIVPAEVQTEHAIGWLQWHLFHRAHGLGPTRFFLFVHYMDPHETYDAPQPFGSRYTGEYSGTLKPEDHLVTMFLENDFPSREDYEYAVALYDGEISYVDHELGRLLGTLEQYGLLDATLIVLTSDHGEEFKDHGGMGHKTSLHTEQLHVPLILRYPQVFAGGQRVASQASLVDIYPTIASTVGVEVPAHAQGVDLGAFAGPDGRVDGRPSKALQAPPQLGELGPMDRPWESKLQRRSIRTERYKLIFEFDEGATRLYDIRKDPAEQDDLYPSMRRARFVRALEKKLRDFIARGATYAPGARLQNQIQVDEETQAQLRELGYLE